jgi:hypothetical protein
MHNPPHPGEFIRTIYLEPFAMSARSLAESLAVLPSTLNRAITGKSGGRQNKPSSSTGFGPLSLPQLDGDTRANDTPVFQIATAVPVPAQIAKSKSVLVLRILPQGVYQIGDV